jgi:hypothetical protein
LRSTTHLLLSNGFRFKNIWKIPKRYIQSIHLSIQKSVHLFIDLPWWVRQYRHRDHCQWANEGSCPHSPEIPPASHRPCLVAGDLFLRWRPRPKTRMKRPHWLHLCWEHRPLKPKVERQWPPSINQTKKKGVNIFKRSGTCA